MRRLLACDPALVPGEHRLLRMFADLRVLSRRRHDEADAEALLRSPQEHLHAWLRSLDAEAEGLPATFVEQLRRALAHYGVESLDRTPALEEACYRLFLAEQRAETARAAIVAILDRRLEQAEQLAGHVGDDFREVLDRLVAAPEGRDPVLADLAREVRFRYFDEPVIAAARERVYAEMEAHLAALAADPARPDRDERVAALVACPQPLAALLSARMRAAEPPLRRLLLEAMVRRYYRVRSLEGFEQMELDGHAFLIGRYTFEQRRRHLAAAYVELEDVAAVAAAFARHAAALPDGDLAVLDLYAEHAGQAPPHEELAETLLAALAAVPLLAGPAPDRRRDCRAEPRPRHVGDRPVHLPPRAGGPRGGRGPARAAPDDGHRLDLWRLSNFALERLPSAEDVYVFHGVARTNPKDERLFALAEVRDLTPSATTTGASSPSRSSSGCSSRCSRRSAASRRTARRAAACSGTACCSTCGR